MGILRGLLGQLYLKFVSRLGGAIKATNLWTESAGATLHDTLNAKRSGAYENGAMRRGELTAQNHFFAGNGKSPRTSL